MGQSFPVGAIVIWSRNVPAEWLFIYTPGPMKVELAWYNDGTPSEYAKKFHPNGMSFEPGFMYEVTFDISKSTYYNPPAKAMNGEARGRFVVHEKWLRWNGDIEYGSGENWLTSLMRVDDLDEKGFWAWVRRLFSGSCRIRRF